MANSSTQVLRTRIRPATVGRAALMTVIAVAAWQVGSGFARLYRESQLVVAPPVESPAGAAEFNALASVLPMAGPWEFADTNWNLQSRVMPRDDVDRRLKELSGASPGVDAAELPDLSPELSEYVAKLQLTPIARAGNSVYVVDKPTFKAELVVCELSGKQKAVGLAVGLPTTADNWQVFELTPRRLSSSVEASESHLLPLPSGAVRRGGRFADDGRLLLELVSLNTTTGDLVARWKAAGWEVRRSGLGDPSAFSYLCARGEEMIYAWSANPGETLESLMLVRSPTDAELQGQQLETGSVKE